MSNEEHLIENAVTWIEKGKTYEDFADAKLNKEMAKVSNIDLHQVWMMATHVVYTLKECWISDVVAYFQGEEPFDADIKEYIERLI